VGSRREVCAIAIAAAEPEAERAGRLTSRENQVVTLAALGHSNKAIAHELGLAPGTVGVILTRVTTKLGATSPRHLVSTWLRADQL
jgi:DNA-binding NarL/FixJ family response regulator